MFSLNYTSTFVDNMGCNVNGNTTMLFNTEEEINSFLDLVSERETILTVSVTEKENYTPRKRVVVATTRSWE